MPIAIRSVPGTYRRGSVTSSISRPGEARRGRERRSEAVRGTAVVHAGVPLGRAPPQSVRLHPGGAGRGGDGNRGDAGGTVVLDPHPERGPRTGAAELDRRPDPRRNHFCAPGERIARTG